MKKYIHVKKEDREFIAKVFGITPRMVFNAVHFESDSELARKVRKLAMDRGGIVMVEAPEAETLFDADGYMRQYLPGGVLLEFKYSDNSCTVFVKGEERRRFDDVHVRDIRYILEFAGNFYKAAAQQRPTEPAPQMA